MKTRTKTVRMKSAKGNDTEIPDIRALVSFFVFILYRDELFLNNCAEKARRLNCEFDEVWGKQLSKH